jgi:hypothetical protein
MKQAQTKHTLKVVLVEAQAFQQAQRQVQEQLELEPWLQPGTASLLFDTGSHDGTFC